MFAPHPKPPPRERKRRPMRQRSEKRARVYAGTEDAEGRAALVARILTQRPRCEAGVPIGRLALLRAGHNPDDPKAPSVLCGGCQGRSVDVHERTPRSAGGSLFDPDNLLAVCRACHRWIHEHPLDAIALGLRRSRYTVASEETETT